MNIHAGEGYAFKLFSGALALKISLSFYIHYHFVCTSRNGSGQTMDAQALLSICSSYM